MFDEYGIPRGAEPGEADMPVLFHFVYCSRGAEGIDDAEVSRIVEVAQRDNLARGITGVLVFGSGIFFQWIEGPAAQMKKSSRACIAIRGITILSRWTRVRSSGSASIRHGTWRGLRPTISVSSSKTRWRPPKTRIMPQRSGESWRNSIQGLSIR